MGWCMESQSATPATCLCVCACVQLIGVRVSAVLAVLSPKPRVCHFCAVDWAFISQRHWFHTRNCPCSAGLRPAGLCVSGGVTWGSTFKTACPWLHRVVPQSRVCLMSVYDDKPSPYSRPHRAQGKGRSAKGEPGFKGYRVTLLLGLVGRPLSQHDGYGESVSHARHAHSHLAAWAATCSFDDL